MLSGRQFVLDGLGYVVDGGVLAQLLELLIVGDALQPYFSGDLAVHTEYGGDLFLCQEEDCWERAGLCARFWRWHATGSTHNVCCGIRSNK
jgi:hypothetical protein